jgi:hypothetical protein
MTDRPAPISIAFADERFGGTRALRLAMIASLPLAVLIGAAIAYSPLIGVIGAFAVALAVVVLASGHRAVTLFLVALTGLLVAYATLGRGIAHAGVPPIYIGEAVLGLAVLAIIASIPRIRVGPVELAILLFMAWGAIRTFPYFGTYEFDALRDGVIWGYGVFALAVAWTVRSDHVRLIVRLYRRLVPLLLIWTPLAAFLTLALSEAIPNAPGSEVPIIFFKAGDAGVHLAGIAAFILTGLYTAVAPASATRQVLLWSGWLVGVAVSGAVGRGGLLATSVIVATALFVRASQRWLALILVGAFMISLAVLVNPIVKVPERERAVSIQQLAMNLLSIVADTGTPELEGTRTWRLNWWGDIVDYTFGGPYLWAGKGYGINLADDDGFQVTDDRSLRSPHSSHFEILARGGVVGLALWILVQAAFLWTVVRAARRAHAAGQTMWVAVFGWLVVYWAAALVNSSFDVYFQGPQGGIWFWAIMGLGIAATRLWMEPLELREPRGQSASPPPSRATAPEGRESAVSLPIRRR